MRRLIVLALCGAVSGCGTYLPGLTSERIVPIALLMKKIECEFQQAVWRQIYYQHRHFLKKWQAVYSVTLKSNETGGLQAKTNTFPFILSPKALANVNVGASGTATANRTALLKFSLDFAAVPKTQPKCKVAVGDSLHPFISGNIGFAEWMDRAFDGAESASTPIDSLGHTFEFSIDVSATAASEFLIGAAAPLTSLNPGISMERLDDGIIDVAIAPAATVSATTTAIIELTKAERDLIEELRGELQKAKERKAFAQKELAVEENQKLLKLFPNLNQMTPMGVTPSPDADTINKLGISRESITADKLRKIQDFQKQEDQASRDILELSKRIKDETPKPAIVTKQVRVPADQNGVISSTQLQLTFERLNNSLRVPIR